MIKALLVLLVLLIAVPVFAQTATPTPVPTIVIPLGEIGDIGQSSDQGLSNLGNSIEAPNGVSLLPNETGTLIFGYAKWLTDPVTADQITGPLAPIVTAIGRRIGLEFILLAIYIGVYVAVYGVRWVIWIARIFLQLFQTIASVTGGLLGALAGLIGL